MAPKHDPSLKLSLEDYWALGPKQRHPVQASLGDGFEQQLVQAKTPLVQFRGQWVELDQDNMQQMLEFWQKQQAENPEISLLDFMKLTATGAGGDLAVEYDRQDVLADMLAKLKDRGQLQPVEDPLSFQGQLREYQRWGVAWLQYLEHLGLNGCLADDMGLG